MERFDEEIRRYDIIRKERVDSMQDRRYPNVIMVEEVRCDICSLCVGKVKHICCRTKNSFYLRPDPIN